MSITGFTKTLSVLLLALGVVAFVPAVLQAPLIDDPMLNVSQWYGRVFGLFPTNIIHNIVRIAFGVWGLMAARNIASATTFCRNMTVIYALFTIMGFIPGLNTLFGLVPLFGHDIWLSALIALSAAYYGFRTAAMRATTTNGFRTPHPRV